MPTYVYTAVNTMGKQVRDTIDAANEELAKHSLRDAGFKLLELRPQKAYERSFDIPFLGKPRSKDMSIFCRQMSSILRAGVPVATALEMMGEQTENKSLAKAVRQMQTDVVEGDSLAAAMGRHRNLFPSMLISMIAAGEESGNLEGVFLQMEVYFDKATRTKSSVAHAMIYPIILLIVMAIVMVVMMVYIVPMFTETYESTGTELPAITRAVISFSDFVANRWWLLILIFAALVAGIMAFRRTKQGRYFFGFLSRKMPVLGKLVVRSACSTLCRMLSLLLSSGITLLEGLDLAAANMANIYFEDAVRTARDLVAEGWPLNVSLRDTGLFPPLVVNMAAVGENSGDLQGTLEKLADFYDQEVADQTSKLLSVLEPIMILIMAGFVIVLVLAIYLPMLGMTHAYDQYLN